VCRGPDVATQQTGRDETLSVYPRLRVRHIKPTATTPKTPPPCSPVTSSPGCSLIFFTSTRCPPRDGWMKGSTVQQMFCVHACPELVQHATARRAQADNVGQPSMSEGSQKNG
jgi:hypothetical protein